VTKKQLPLEDENRNVGAVSLTPVAAAVITALLPASAVVAQDQGVSDEVIEEIVTTGSRIRRDSFSSAAPMDVVLTEAASAKGINDVATLLQTTTVAAGAPQVTTASSAAGFVTEGLDPANGGAGTSTLSLRGLGANRTLVLLNGRRAGPAGTGGAVSAFDLGAIPLSAIERVEVLKDGASSIYGSDAVAGVVNLITKKSDGATFEAFISQPSDSGGEQSRINGSWGKRFERGYFRATASYNKTEILKRKDREFFSCSEDYSFDTTTGERADLIDPRTGTYLCNDLPWGHVWVYDYAAEVGGDGDGTTTVQPPTNLFQYDFDGALAANGVTPLPPATNPNHMVAPEGWFPIRQGDALSNSLYDAQHPFFGEQTLMPDNEVATLLLEGEYDVSDKVSVYSEFLINRRETDVRAYRQIWTYIYNYDGADWGGWVDDPDLRGNDPFAQGWTGAQWLSPLSVTDKAGQKVEVDYTRIVIGAKGENETFLAGWNWDLSYQYSKSKGDYFTEYTLTDSLEWGFFRTDSCAGDVMPISGKTCVDIDWLDPNFLAGNIPAEVEEFLFDTGHGWTDYEQWSVEGFMTGEIFEMPAGSAAMAIGFHYRDDEILDNPGEIVLSGNNWQSGSGGITTGNSQTTAVFAEFDFPLLADKPMVEYLDFNVSARYTETDHNGRGLTEKFSDTTYKVGVNWAMTDQFRVRSTFGTSFRTPALFELFLADSSSSLSARAADPCINWESNLNLGIISDRVAANCAADNIPPDHVASVGPSVLTGGGIGLLVPETSEAFTFGFVWQPAFADLNFSVDYFDIEVTDEVDKIGGADIVLGCYSSEFFPNEPLCDQFDRDLPTAPLPNAILEIRDQFINVAIQRIKGMDIAGQWTTDMPGTWGALTINGQVTLNFEDIVGLFDNTQRDLSGRAGHPDTVSNLNFTLNKDKWSLFWGINYVGETDNLGSFGRNTVTDSTGTQVGVKLNAESVTYHSLSGSYDFDNGLVARVGIANVADEAPPRMTSLGTSNEVDVLGNAAFYSQYDWLGRRYFVNLTMNFE
jgi:iron complex outermembrane receptor protein